MHPRCAVGGGGGYEGRRPDADVKTRVLGSAKPYIRLARGLLSVVLPATQPILENSWDID